MPPRQRSTAAETRPTPRTARRPRSRTASVQQVHPAAEPTEDQIRQRAYEIYQARGQTPGDPEADWRQAEHELRGRLQLLGRI